jgi:uncharacterized protein YjiS (DUF1127 family)
MTTTNSYAAEVRVLGSRLLEWFRRRRRARRTYLALCELDDRALADIGLHRSEIASVAWSRLHRLDS